MLVFVVAVVGFHQLKYVYSSHVQIWAEIFYGTCTYRKIVLKIQNQHLENLQFSDVDNTYCISNIDTCLLFIACKLVLHYCTLQMQKSIKRRLLMYLEALVGGILYCSTLYIHNLEKHELNNIRIWHCYMQWTIFQAFPPSINGKISLTSSMCCCTKFGHY